MPKRLGKKKTGPARKKATAKATKEKPKRKAKGRDEVQAAHDLLQQIIAGHDPEARNVLMREMGRKGGKIGGKKRLEWPKEQRIAAAKRAAEARWRPAKP